ncbi:unnamed protein product [Miscanthus lutarioriparius]|uniref:Plant heme peroxidase family profile domain-containing protein n=1 Tax=Miscanthus lutarioriparius TaxID=422564 RepID=A0A811MGT9_9POAL|nr:unnamed protein product [Miscanthus lutarioriparius]
MKNSPRPISAAALASAGSHRLPYPHPHLLLLRRTSAARRAPSPPSVDGPPRGSTGASPVCADASNPPSPLDRQEDGSVLAPPLRHVAVRARGRSAVNAGHGLAGASSAGMINAFKLIQPMKDKYPGITYAELFQLASATAFEGVADPKIIPMTNGRVDVTVAQQCPHEERFPDAGPCDPTELLREVFYTMGLDDKEIVALSGAHTCGRPRPDRSGCGKPETKYVVCFYGLPASV